MGLKDFIFIIFICIFFNACASMGDIEKLDELYYQKNNLEDSYDYSQKYKKDDFLWAMQSGILGFQMGDFENSIKHFNLAESYFEINAQENIFESTFKTIATILVSNAMFEYYGNLYEATFVNYYKALNFMMLKDYASSRVEFNRANDRQRRSKEFFANKINQIQDAINNNQINNLDNQKTIQSIDSIYNSKYKNLDRFRAYDGYINPMVSYVSGIFFLLQNDFNKANDLLKESYAVSKESRILDDIKLLDNRRKNTNTKKYTWIFIEDGRSPKKYEMRLDVPLFLLNSNVMFFNIALPNLDSGKRFYSTYYLSTDSRDSINSFELVNVESMISNEFSIEIPYIIITSIISSTYKAYLQSVLSENLGPIGGIGGMIFSAISTNADIRNSRILPLRFLAMRVENKEQVFRLFGDSRFLYSFVMDRDCKKLCLNKDNIIYIRVMQNGIISILTHSIGD